MKIAGGLTLKPRSLVWLCFTTACALSLSLESHAKKNERRDIRFYKANKILQTDRIGFTRKKGAQLGCHNFIKKARVYKIVQFGYTACHVYSKKDCPADSIVEIVREKDEITSATILQGYGWYPYSDNARGVKLRSWACSTEAPDPSSFIGTEVESRKAAKARIKKEADDKARKEAKERAEKEAEKRDKNKPVEDIDCNLERDIKSELEKDTECNLKKKTVYKLEEDVEYKEESAIEVTEE